MGYVLGNTIRTERTADQARKLKAEYQDYLDEFKYQQERLPKKKTDGYVYMLPTYEDSDRWLRIDIEEDDTILRGLAAQICGQIHNQNLAREIIEPQFQFVSFDTGEKPIWKYTICGDKPKDLLDDIKRRLEELVLLDNIRSVNHKLEVIGTALERYEKEMKPNG